MPNITVEFDSAPIVDRLTRLSAELSPAGRAGRAAQGGRRARRGDYARG